MTRDEKRNPMSVEDGSAEDMATPAQKALIRRNRIRAAEDYKAMEQWAANGFTSAPDEGGDNPYE